jgi:hypothetical protein
MEARAATQAPPAAFTGGGGGAGVYAGTWGPNGPTSGGYGFPGGDGAQGVIHIGYDSANPSNSSDTTTLASLISPSDLQADLAPASTSDSALDSGTNVESVTDPTTPSFAGSMAAIDPSAFTPTVSYYRGFSRFGDFS